MEWKKYIVGLVDLLGQSRKLEEFGSLWWNLHDSGNLSENESRKMTELKKKTCVEVEHFRKKFPDFFVV